MKAGISFSMLVACSRKVTNIQLLPCKVKSTLNITPSTKKALTCRRWLHSSLRNLKRNKDDVTLLSEDFYSNPIDKLQPLIQVPIVPMEDAGFRPTRDEIIQGSEFFEPQNFEGESFEFLGSYPNPHIMPQWGLPEVAFIGKSNVGKSSLLSSMFVNVPDVHVKTSKKPGHTKLMNVFNVKNKFHLVDMPGYGFNMPEHFETSVEAYIKSRRNVMTFILFDGSIGATTNDQKYFRKYSGLNLPLAIVLTKIDLAKQGKLLRNLMSVLKFRDESGAFSCYPQPFLVSSVTGEGIAFLQTFIAYITGSMAIKSLSPDS